MPFAFFFLLLTFWSPLNKNEELSFDIEYRGSTIGHLEATYKQRGKREYFTSETSFSTTLFKEIRINFDTEVIYEDGRLQESLAKVKVNGTLHQHTSIRWKGDHYQITKDHEHTSTHNTPIHFSTIHLLFWEPPQKYHQIFSEHEGVYHELISHESSKYEKVKPSGKSFYYHYQKGKLDKAKLQASFLHYSIHAK